MKERRYIKLEARGHLPTIIYLDQISSVVSLGILGTRIVTKEVVDGKNVEYVFSVDFDFVEEEIQRAGRSAIYGDK